MRGCVKHFTGDCPA